MSSRANSSQLQDKGHREYYLDLDSTLDLFRIESLHSLSILTAFGAHDNAYDEEVIKPLWRTSNITDLAFDEFEGEETPDSIISMLSIPKSLKALRWT
jgi:hypothetical protein